MATTPFKFDFLIKALKSHPGYEYPVSWNHWCKMTVETNEQVMVESDELFGMTVLRKWTS